MDHPFFFDPQQLNDARELCHQACQWPSRAARANLAPAADDSHSNLGWSTNHGALTSHVLDGSAIGPRVAFRFSEPALLWLEDETVNDALLLSAQSEATVKQWLDQHLRAASLQSTDHAEMPYELGAQNAYEDFIALAKPAKALGAWFHYGDNTLKQVQSAFSDIAISQPTVRCWPHHFDLGMLFALEQGDPETARSIGIGMSPGDGSYAEPYFYCSPYPAPDPATVPQVAAPLFWNTTGFTALIVRASGLDPSTNVLRLLKTAMITAQQVI